MFQYYLILILILGTGTLINRNRIIRILLLGLFLLVQTFIAIYGYYHFNAEEAGGYFRFDSLGVIFLSVLTVLSYTTIFHKLPLP